MFKKLVVGALAAGIALTGGVAASASTENTTSLTQECDSRFEFDRVRFDGDKYSKYICQPSGVFANYFEKWEYYNGEYVKIKWYLKYYEGSTGYYEGRAQ
ncbi:MULTISPECIES: hypothetical protein [Bacillus]|uniref:Uncharacterized protein n=3 Tax=Bacillus cereus group TaxID=86661 RepID=A0A243CYW9_BACTU|nr:MULTISPECIES: hypothetical protein [Bacillus]EEM61192.1 hypothetical protein bthur0007_8750 [Bacillus thuringiensis serovar monterrey BGSC 4AJ1]EEM86251.1 hypothetical protein bthur0012_57430 [Bacillus thuringiensis serovar pulsiensis BGSC 4CC1]MEB9672369.1 hypothetical protein [Bacillus anthracis]MEB9908215.1 hypothetical protein [Bacillus anthracis]MEC1956974.1 hypothetical protein [Bacillus anthracis]